MQREPGHGGDAQAQRFRVGFDDIGRLHLFAAVIGRPGGAGGPRFGPDQRILRARGLHRRANRLHHGVEAGPGAVVVVMEIDRVGVGGTARGQEIGQEAAHERPALPVGQALVGEVVVA